MDVSLPMSGPRTLKRSTDPRSKSLRPASRLVQPMSPLSPCSSMYTLASVPAPRLCEVCTVTAYTTCRRERVSAVQARYKVDTIFRVIPVKLCGVECTLAVIGTGRPVK
eukprot:999589-Prorocentrum_minimum.AAC.1